MSSSKNSFTWRRIQEDWLRGFTVVYPPEMVVESFNALESYLGNEYLNKIKARGSMTVLPLIELGLLLKEIGPLDNASSIIAKLKRNDRSARSEGMMIAHYSGQGLPVTIEPEVKVKEELKHPDLLIEYHGVKIFVEVASPMISDEIKRINELMENIVQVSKRIDQPRNVNVYLLREPSEGEIEKIRNICVLMSANDAQPRHCEMGDLGSISSKLLSDQEVPKAILQQIPNVDLLFSQDSFVVPSIVRDKYQETPYMFQMQLYFKEFPIKTINRVHVWYPVTDERLERIINEERVQLSPKEHNMIVLDVTGIPGVFSSRTSSWIKWVRRRLQPQLNRRIGAVLLISTAVDSKRILVEKHLVKHPNPYHTLPEGFLERTLQNNLPYFKRKS